MPLFPLAALVAAWLALAAVPAASQVAGVPASTLGRCVGGAPESPPSGGAPFDYRRDPRERTALENWKLLGYAPDERTGRLLGPDGVPAGAELVSWLRAPEDFARERVDVHLWMSLTYEFRLNEADCLMRDAGGAPLSRFDYRVKRENIRRGIENDTLEKLKVRLAALDPSAPLPADLAAQMKSLSDAGAPTPPAVRRLLDGARVTVGDLARSVDAAYADSTRFFDGRSTLGGLALAALPTSAAVPADRTRAYVAPEEERLGRMLAADLSDRFGATDDAGRDMFDHLRDKKGRVNLPPVLLLKASQRPEESFAAAFYSDETGAVTLNHWTAVQALLASLPPEERERRAREFADPHALRLFLESHPRERAEMLDGIDGIFYHEFIHVWQARRLKLDIEKARGNVASGYPIEWEFEAFREECRFDLVKALRDPLSLERAFGGPDYCLGMLKSYDAFEDGVRRAYQQSAIAINGADALPDVFHRQEARKSMARALMDDGLFQKAAQALKLQGMLRGDEALKDAESDDARRKREFLTERLPDLRRRVAAALPDAYLALGRADLAIRVLAYLPDDTPGASGDRARLATALFPLLTRPTDKLLLPDRLQAYALMGDPKKWPPELWGAYWRDSAAQAAEIKKQAAAAKSAEDRARLLDEAKQWDKVLTIAAESTAAMRKQAAAAPAADRANELKQVRAYEDLLKRARTSEP